MRSAAELQHKQLQERANDHQMQEQLIAVKNGQNGLNGQLAVMQDGQMAMVSLVEHSTDMSKATLVLEGHKHRQGPARSDQRGRFAPSKGYPEALAVGLILRNVFSPTMKRLEEMHTSDHIKRATLRKAKAQEGFSRSMTLCQWDLHPRQVWLSKHQVICVNTW